MTFDQLHFFYVLAETLNYTKAAEILYISQPTLSRQILLLEEEFQVKLFIRNYKSMRLSPAGEIFMEECKKLLFAADRLRERMAQFKFGSQGTLVCSSLGMFYPEIQDLFRSFCDENPDVRLVMQQQPTGNVKEAVLSGVGDIGLCFSFELAEEDDFDIDPLFNENFRLLISDRHPLAGRKSVSIREIQNEHLILLGNDNFPFVRALWEKIEFFNVMRTAEIHTPNSIQTVILNVQTGRFASIIPAPLTRSAVEGCVSLEIEDLDSSFQTVMIWKHDNENPALIMFLKHLREFFSQGSISPYR